MPRLITSSAIGWVLYGLCLSICLLHISSETKLKILTSRFLSSNRVSPPKHYLPWLHLPHRWRIFVPLLPCLPCSLCWLDLRKHTGLALFSVLVLLATEAQRGHLSGASQRLKSPSPKVYYYHFFFIYILEWRREESETVHWGHKKRWQSSGCKGELPAKCITSLRRKLPIDLISEGRGKRRVWGKSRKRITVSFYLCLLKKWDFFSLYNLNLFSS